MLKEKIILNVANALMVELVIADHQRDRVSDSETPKPYQTNNLEAWETLYRGMKSYRRYRKEDNAQAREFFTMQSDSTRMGIFL